MGKATLRAKEYTDKGDIHPEHRKRPHKHEETVLCTQILTVSSNTQLLLQTPSPFYNWIKPADRANSCRGPFRCVKSSSVICLVRTPSDIVSSTAAPLDSATTTALAKATITRSLLTDQSIILLHRLYVDEVYAQAEREGWSNSRIEQAIRRCSQQEDKEIQSFLTAVEEAESRNARLNDMRRQDDRYSGAEEYEVDPEDNEDDPDESDSEAERTSSLVATSCGQRNYTDLDDESCGSDNEGPPGRVLHCRRFPSSEGPGLFH
ncbi:MAG: hypothetical protein ASARMPRED_006215 [Alectoria sarmentosa]|nr:MAG: hypothetical protein ASARMPRED_006215 [Alectoria sarmentosa]